MEYGAPLWRCVTVPSRQPLKIGPLPGMFHDAGHQVVRRVGAGRPTVGLGIGAVLRREPVIEPIFGLRAVYDAVRMSGVVRC